ncbi:MAG: carboxypeptidase-like regulatory domain-containing protein [Candidatus Ratteibacteria bacterium]|nr:carboxypeptidase-like regulatory domain-containing protein [Candidatus Ratteibacteria bacterium]
MVTASTEHCNAGANQTNISGNVLSFNGTAIAGATVFNVSNSSVTTTTDANGLFNLTCVGESMAGDNGGNGITYGTMKVKAAGYTEVSVLFALYPGNLSGKYFYNDSFLTANGHNISMDAIDPSLSGAAASSITRTTATFGWTVATSTDNLTNAYVGNRIIWYSGGIVNQTSSWTNSTLTPSVSLSSLHDGQLYSVIYETYNRADSAGHRTISSTTFTTKKSQMGAILASEERSTVKPTTTAPSGALAILTSPNKTPQQRNIIVVGIVAILGIIVYFGYYAKK